VSLAALFAGCDTGGTAGIGPACAKLTPALVGITRSVKHRLAHGVLSASEQRALAKFQHEAKARLASAAGLLIDDRVHVADYTF
jgi:hypothetical protein